jgi:hypothetical protein
LNVMIHHITYITEIVMKFAQMDIILKMVYVLIVTVLVKHATVEQQIVVILALLHLILSGIETHVSTHAQMVNGKTNLIEDVMIVIPLVLLAQLEHITIVTVVKTHIIWRKLKTLVYTHAQMVIMKKTQQEHVKLVILVARHAVDLQSMIVILAQMEHSSMKDNVLAYAQMENGQMIQQILVILVMDLAVLALDQIQMIVTLVAQQQQILIFKMMELVSTHAHLLTTEEIVMELVNHAMTLAWPALDHMTTNVWHAQLENTYMLMELVYQSVQFITMQMMLHGHVNHVYLHVLHVQVLTHVPLVLINGIYTEMIVLLTAQNKMDYGTEMTIGLVLNVIKHVRPVMNQLLMITNVLLVHQMMIVYKDPIVIPISILVTLKIQFVMSTQSQSLVKLIV